ncbi:hypothetical protein ACVWZV_002233 [Bradyrhizobium sp. GM5.1]
MILPLKVIGWNNFSLGNLEAWVTLHQPKEIGMTDNQYAHFATLCGRNKRDYKSIPIVFLDAPKPAL